MYEIDVIGKMELTSPKLVECRDIVSRLNLTAEQATMGVACALADVADFDYKNCREGFKNYEDFAKRVFGISKSQAYSYRDAAKLIMRITNEKGVPVGFKDVFHDSPAESYSVNVLKNIARLLNPRNTQERAFIVDDLVEMYEKGTFPPKMTVKECEKKINDILNPSNQISGNANENGDNDNDNGDNGENGGDTTNATMSKTEEVQCISLTIPVWFVNEHFKPELARCREECPSFDRILAAIESAMRTPAASCVVNVGEKPETLEELKKKVES